MNMAIHTTVFNDGTDSASELHDHVDGGAGSQVVVLDAHLVCQLLSSEDQSDHLYIDTFLLLKHLLDLQDSVRRLKVEILLGSRQSLPHKANISHHSTVTAKALTLMYNCIFVSRVKDFNL